MAAMVGGMGTPEIRKPSAKALAQAKLTQARLVFSTAGLLLYALGAELAAKTHFLGLQWSGSHTVAVTVASVLGLRLVLREIGSRRRYERQIATIDIMDHAAFLMGETAKNLAKAENKDGS